jgi:hypothetical protein
LTLSPKVEAASGVGRWRDVRARRSVRALPLRGSRGLFVKQLFLQGLELRVRPDVRTDQTAPVGGTAEIPQQSRTNSPTCAQRLAGE